MRLWRRNLTYSVLSFATLGMVLSLFAILWQLVRDSRADMSFNQENALWHISQAISEFADFERTLSALIQGHPKGNRQELVQNFDILWSRLHGFDNGTVDALLGGGIADYPGRIRDLQDKLLAIEATLFEGSDLLLEFDRLKPRLDDLYLALRYFSVDALNAKQALLNQTRDQRLNYYYFGAAALAMSFLCAALILTLCVRNLRSLQQLRATLEQQVAQRTHALAAEEAKLRLILASVDEGILGLAPTGRCAFCNPAAATLLGFSDEAALQQRDLHDLFSELAGEPFIARSLQGPHSSHQAIFRRRDGSRLMVQYRAHPLVQRGEVIGAVVAFNDISERIQREQEQLRRQKLETIGQLSGSIAHDFNNLLTVIEGNLNLAQLEPGLSEEASDLINDALAATADGAALTRQLLSFTRDRPANEQPVELAALLHNFARLARRTLAENIALQLNCEAKEPFTAHIDPHLLENALFNLIANAQQAMGEGGHLNLSLETVEVKASTTPCPNLPQGRYHRIDIIDTGLGMDQETLKHACEPFFTTKPGSGTGLGLSSVASFVRRSGGALKLISQRQQGTTVSLFLPASAGRAEPQTVPIANPLAEGSGEWILVVEDQEPVRRFAVKSLQRLGYRTLEASSGREAIRHLTNQREIALVFSDIVMPGELDGHQLADWIERHRPEVGVVLVTGFIPEHVQQRNNHHTNRMLLRKPYSLEALADAISQGLNAQLPLSRAN